MAVRRWFASLGRPRRSPVDEVMARASIDVGKVRPAFDAEPESDAARAAFEAAAGEVQLWAEEHGMEFCDMDPELKTRLQCLLVKWAASTLPRWTALIDEHGVTHKLVDDGWLPCGATDFLAKEQARLEDEQGDIEAEADGLQPGWGQDLYARAWRVHRHTLVRDAEGALWGRKAKGVRGGRGGGGG